MFQQFSALFFILYYCDQVFTNLFIFLIETVEKLSFDLIQIKNFRREVDTRS